MPHVVSFCLGFCSYMNRYTTGGADGEDFRQEGAEGGCSANRNFEATLSRASGLNRRPSSGQTARFDHDVWGFGVNWPFKLLFSLVLFRVPERNLQDQRLRTRPDPQRSLQVRPDLYLKWSMITWTWIWTSSSGHVTSATFTLISALFPPLALQTQQDVAEPV